MEAILAGQKRLLLTLATGTGKTPIAAQIVYKLWSSRWNTKGRAGRRPKILFLADRNFLVDDPYSKHFAMFGEARLAGRAAMAETWKELSALMPSVLDRAFKGEL